MVLQPRKGNTGKDAINDCPGRPSDPSTFLETESNEQKTAAYIGYSQVAELRQLAISWPLMKAYPKFDAVCSGLSRKSAFLLILANEDAYTDVNPEEKWPLSDKSDNIVRSRHIATILIQVERDLKYRFAPQGNSAKNNLYRTQFRQKYPSLTVPNFNEECPAPELGPLQKEHRLESINRCWVLLRYMRYCIQAKYWNSRFSQDGVAVRVSVAQSHIPGWMREPETILRPAIAPQGEVAVADNLSPISVKVLWQRNKRFPGYEEFMSLLETAEEKGVAIPNSEFLLPDDHDPRLFKTIFAFKDCLRRLYRCQEIGMDIKRLHLDYIIKSSEEPMHVDILLQDWDETLAIFDDKDFSSFSVKVVFAVFEDSCVSLYESDDPLPALNSYFTTTESDFALNVHAG